MRWLGSSNFSLQVFSLLLKYVYGSLLHHLTTFIFEKQTKKGYTYNNCLLLYATEPPLKRTSTDDS